MIKAFISNKPAFTFDVHYIFSWQINSAAAAAAAYRPYICTAFHVFTVVQYNLLLLFK